MVVVRYCYDLNLMTFLILVFLTLFPSAFSDINNDRLALLNLRSIVRGKTLLWNTSSDTPCTWEGVTCDNTTGRVVSLRLPGDGLMGKLTLAYIGNLTELRVLSLRGNRLSGPIPEDLASCKNLRDLHLQGNRFSGEIPRSIFDLKNLLRVNLAGNNLSGALSSEFNTLTKLRILYLENNQFTGPLPDLDGLTNLKQFNVSFNNLITGSIPPSLTRFSSESFQGTLLCGGNLSSSCFGNNGNDKLSSGAIAGIASGSFVALILIAVVLLLSWRKCIKRDQKNIPPRMERSQMQYSTPVNPPRYHFSNSETIKVTERDKDIPLSNNTSRRIHAKERLEYDDGLVFFRDDVKAFTLQELLMSSAQVMGKGTTGTRYKVYLDSGVEVIVKRLKNICLSENEFRSKLEVLGSLHHENLLPLIGCFYGRDEKLLIYKSMSRGISLFELLHGNGKQQLSWETRIKIALGIARGIEYLHSMSPVITHGNINSSNVLLADYYEPCLSEFGLMQLVFPGPNLNGYKAPEVSDTRNVSQQTDVYSFGVLLLELLTGKEPDNVLSEEGIELPKQVRSVDEGKSVYEMIDHELEVGLGEFKEEIVKLTNIAITCTASRPEDRDSIVEVVRCIKNVCG